MSKTLSAVISFFIVVVTFISCKKEGHSPMLFGFYTEASPVDGRSKLEFTFGNKVTLFRDLTANNSSSSDTYYYKLSPGKIKLIPAWIDNDPGLSFDFIQTNSDSFKIGNLYPNIPEA